MVHTNAGSDRRTTIVPDHQAFKGKMILPKSGCLPRKNRGSQNRLAASFRLTGYIALCIWLAAPTRTPKWGASEIGFDSTIFTGSDLVKRGFLVSRTIATDFEITFAGRST
jgi:hypothetical protein